MVIDIFFLFLIKKLVEILFSKFANESSTSEEEEEEFEKKINETSKYKIDFHKN